MPRTALNFTVKNASASTITISGTDIGSSVIAPDRYVPNGFDETQGALADTPATVADATPFSVVGILKGILKQLFYGASALTKREDDAHASNDVGVMALGVRQDTIAALAGTTGDYSPFSLDSLGRVYVTIDVAAGTIAKAEDAASASGDVGVMVLAKRSDTPAATSGTDGDYEPLQVAAGRLWCNIGDTEIGAPSAAYGQQALSTSATQIAAARATRRSITVTNTSTTPIYLGPSGVTTSNGHYLAGVAGASLTFEHAAAVYGIVASGTPTVTYFEEYR